MNIFQHRAKNFEPKTASPNFHEQWVVGTYVVTGLFGSTVSNLTINDIESRIPQLYDMTRQAQHAWWPRGIAGYYLITIYSGTVFDSEVIEWVHLRPKYRWAVWHEPILYNLKSNSIEMNRNWGRYCAAFRPYLSDILRSQLAHTAKEHGFDDGPEVDFNIQPKKKT